MITHTKSNGFTLIELLLVIAIIAIISGMSTPFLSNFILRNNLDTAQNKLISSLRKAQSYAMNEKNGQDWGVCIIDNNIRLFSSDCLNPSHQENFSFPSSLTITGFNSLYLENNNVTGVIFDKNGEINQAVNITLQTNIETKNLIINKLGTIE